MKLPLPDRPLLRKAESHAVGAKTESTAGEAPKLEFRLNVSGLPWRQAFSVFWYKKGIAARSKLHSYSGICLGLRLILVALSLTVYQARLL